MKPTKLQVLKYLSLKILKSMSVFILMFAIFLLCWPFGLRVWSIIQSNFDEDSFPNEIGVAACLSFGVIMILATWAKETGVTFWKLFPLLTAGLYLVLSLIWLILLKVYAVCQQMYLKSEQEIVAANPTEMKDLLLRAAEKPNTLCMPAEEPRYQKERSR